MNNLILLVFSLAFTFVLSSKEIRSRNLVVPAGRPKGRITSGRDATEGQFPYQVFIHIQKQNLELNWCSGSIIHNEWVLTASHCFQDAKEFQIVMGSSALEDVNAVKYLMDLKSVIIHKDYNRKTYEHDIALIKIPFTDYTEKIQPAKLPEICKTYSAYSTKRVIASGWGYTDLKTYAVNSILQWAVLRTIPNNLCQLDAKIKIFPTNICTVPIGDGNICYGDSGGPLVLESSKTQIGLISKGCGIHHPPAIGVYIRLTAYLEWIEETIGLNFEKCKPEL